MKKKPKGFSLEYRERTKNLKLIGFKNKKKKKSLKILQFRNLYELREKWVKTGTGHCKVAESKERKLELPEEKGKYSEERRVANELKDKSVNYKKSYKWDGERERER